MNKLFFVITLFVVTCLQQGFAQENPAIASSPILSSYYNLKDALVENNSRAAAVSAGAFVKAVNAADKGTIKEESRKALLSDAGSILETRDIKVQREKFTRLSSNMLILAKSTKLSSDPVYQQYCPMKKASWLSDKEDIKNPYYGSAMLTCGSVKETL